MGMYGVLGRVTQAQLDMLRANPDLVEQFVSVEEEEGQEPIEGEFTDEDMWWPEGRLLDLDKSWDVLQFLINGGNRQGIAHLRGVVLGGTEIGPDLGYGPARFLTSDEVRETATALAALPEADVLRFDLERLEAEKVYPGFWKPLAPPKARLFRRKAGRIGAEAAAVRDRNTSEFKEFVRDRYRALVAFYLEAARAGDAMLLWIG